MFLFISPGKFSLPYINCCIEASSEAFLSPNGRANAMNVVRRSRRCMSNVNVEFVEL